MALTLIKNATVVTMDPEIGDIEDGDVLVDGQRIAHVGRNVSAPAASLIDGRERIVIPGLVNAHIHTWEYQLRGIAADWVGARDYSANIHNSLATRYGARDVFLGNLLGALNQIRGGATTILDWCDVVRDSEMTDAAIDALEEAGLRAVFARESGSPYGDMPFPREEIRRLRTGRLASDDRLVTLAMAIGGPDRAEYEVTAHDIRLAREYGLLNCAHTCGRSGKRAVQDGLRRLAAEGLLGPDHNIAHANCLSEDDLKIVLDAGCSITATSLTEMLDAAEPAMLGRILKLGAAPSLGTECDAYFNGSMLWVTRHAFQHQREMDNRSLGAAGRWPADQHATHTRDALYWGTMGGAKALRLDGKIGSLTPGKQADLAVIGTRGMNVFPALHGGDPAHAVVMYAENADVESVMVAGRFLKRNGKLVFPAERLKKLNAELLESRQRLMKHSGYAYRRVPNGARPERYVY